MRVSLFKRKSDPERIDVPHGGMLYPVAVKRRASARRVESLSVEGLSVEVLSVEEVMILARGCGADAEAMVGGCGWARG